MKNSIGAFPNMSMMMTMFNQLSDLDVSQQFGFRNQENNNQTQILNMVNNFSKYFDVLLMQNNAHNEDDANPIKFNVLMYGKVLLMMDITDDKSLKITTKDIVAAAAINKTAKDISNMTGPLAMISMNIPMLKNGYMLMIVDRQLTNDDGALSVTNDNNLMVKKQTLMAILNVMIQNINSNNKKLTNNCKIEINTDNINFSYCDGEYYEIIFNVSVFLSQKLDITMQIIGSVTMMMNQLQSHLIQSFIVNENDKNIDENDADGNILTEPTSTTSTSQSTNKSDYAFEKRTLNNFNDDDAIVANVKIKIIRYKLMMMESTSKLFSFMQCWCPSFDDRNDELMMIMMGMDQSQHQQQQPDDEYTSSNDDDDAGYMRISDKMQLCQKSLLQSFKESDQQSGIVSKLIFSETVKMMTIEHNRNKNNTSVGGVDGDQPMNISFSHINDKNDTLIVINADNTVNITCDFNYLNYKIKHKINDQIHKDKDSVKDKSCYNNTTTNEESKITTTTNNKNTSSLVDKKKSTSHHHDKATAGTFDEMIECQRREKEMMRQFEAVGGRLRLCGGGEGSLSGASGWGSPPSNTTANNNNNNNSNNPNAGQWGATAQQTPQQNWNQAAQQAGGGPAPSQQGQPPNVVAPGQSQQVGQAQNPNQKPLTPGGPSGGWNQPPQAQIPNPVQQQQQQQVPQVPGNGAPGIVGGGTSAVAAKNQLEQLNSMREALFAQDGWGCQNVNQDTNWDVPGSPEPGPRTGDPAAPVWKSHVVNNGTELWEANLRNGGQPPPQPVQKTPWNHTPTTNIGGTWGEDDESEGNASVWTGGNQSQQAPGWNQGAGANAGAAGGAAMWPATPGKT